jgi:hypothetical protein
MLGVIEVDALFTMSRHALSKDLETLAYYPADRGNSQGGATLRLKSDGVSIGI